MRSLFFIITLCLLSCKSSLNIFGNDVIKPTHEIVDQNISKILDHFLTLDRDFEAWSKYENKVLYLSFEKLESKGYLIQAVPTLKEPYAMPLMKNNYTGYLLYKGVLVIFWDSKTKFFKRTGNLKKNIFNPNKLNIVDQGEYFGCKFLINKAKTELKEKRYFQQPILKLR